jgi:hypothetical protein
MAIRGLLLEALSSARKERCEKGGVKTDAARDDLKEAYGKAESCFKWVSLAMRRNFRYITFILIFSILYECSGLMSTKIGDIRNNPRHYADKEVAVSGKVTGAFSLVVVKYFTLQDDSGDITIVTERPLPKTGERLTVKGVVREAFSIGNETVLVIIEEPEKAE